MNLARLLGWPLFAGTASPPHVESIVVLGTRLTPDSRLTLAGRERVRAGVALWKRGVAPTLVLTGGHGRGARHVAPEADVMAAFAISLGVPSEAIVRETASRSTAENAFACAEMLGAQTVVLVTQPFHLRRAVMWFRRAGFDATGYLIDGAMHRGRWLTREYGALAYDWARGCSRSFSRRGGRTATRGSRT